MADTGTLYGVGVGPGDPELITLKALRILQNISIIAFPAPSVGSSLTREIASEHLNPQAALLPLRMPINSLTPNPEIYQNWQQQLSPLLDEGNDIAVLCEGDPLLYGSFQYIMSLMAGDYPVQVVPGISSVSAAGASLCLPLCSYQEHFHIISATSPYEQIKHTLSLEGACAILKVGKRFAAVREILIDLQREHHAYVVSYASWEKQSSAPLNSLASNAVLPYFSLILVASQPQ